MSGFEGNKSIMTSHSSSLCLNCSAMGTVRDGLSKNITSTDVYLKGEHLHLSPVSTAHGMCSRINPSPDQNTHSCIYSDNSFRLSTGGSNSLNTGKFGDIQSVFTDKNVVNSDISDFSSNIIQAVKRFSAQQAYCRSTGVIPLNVCKFTQYNGSQLLNSTDMKLWAAEAHTLVKSTVTSNYKQARLVVPLGLNVKNWHRCLEHYDITVLCVNLILK